jgi:hypothetical protein
MWSLDMNKIWLLPVMFLVGCSEPVFNEEKTVTTYALDKYAKLLLKDNVKFLKCYPTSTGSMTAVYTVHARDNSFPATIRFDHLNKSYKVYFDVAYRNGPRQKVLNDIDACYNAFKELKDANKTWE